MRQKKDTYEAVIIDKLVHGGQGLGVLEDGRKAFVWNALPGETVSARLVKKKKDYVEAIAEDIVSASPDRIEPKESIYLATSPWQIMTLDAENKAKQAIISETFQRESVELPDFSMASDGKEFGYRNKLEFSFFGDDDGLHYAFYNRGTHQKQIVTSSALALQAINTAAEKLLVALNSLSVRAGDLKSVILRCTQDGAVFAALFVKPLVFPTLPLLEGLSGLKVYHSNPQSPASVATKLLQSTGQSNLHDVLLGTEINYDVIGFFQVNVPVFELALSQIEQATSGVKNKVDMYAGVGTIGIPIGGTRTLVELDPSNVVMARQNVGDLPIEVVQASTENALQHITPDCSLIVDPPRSGLHKDVVDRIVQVKPKQICYLSCNPSTQARDMALLTEVYDVKSFQGYNFFPRTPHIETLAILERK
jgi:23S rRNA (uracil1939-C5)-methyltransferase